MKLLTKIVLIFLFSPTTHLISLAKDKKLYINYWMGNPVELIVSSVVQGC